MHHLSTESTIRHAMDGLCKTRIVDGNEYGHMAGYIGFDLYIGVDEDFNKRDIRVGIHLLRWRGRIIGCANDDFLFPQFSVDKEWCNISTHGSCWADSVMGFIKRVVDDVWENEYESKFCERYKDDGHKFDRERPHTHLFLKGCESLLPDMIKDVQFIDDRGNLRKLFQEFHLA